MAGKQVTRPKSKYKYAIQAWKSVQKQYPGAKVVSSDHTASTWRWKISFKASPKRKTAARKASPKRKTAARKARPKRKTAARKASPKRKTTARKSSPKRKTTARKSSPKRKTTASPTKKQVVERAKKRAGLPNVKGIFEFEKR